MQPSENYCLYYQAKLVRKKIWYVTGILRYEDHWCFDRTIDKTNNILEFFVPHAFKDIFEHRMTFFIAQGLVEYCTQLPNRLMQEQAR